MLQIAAMLYYTAKLSDIRLVSIYTVVCLVSVGADFSEVPGLARAYDLEGRTLTGVEGPGFWWRLLGRVNYSQH